MIFPIRTEMVFRRTPIANYVLIALNAVAYLVLDVLGSRNLAGVKSSLVLHTDWPLIHQFVTYQFIHAGTWHLLGNMVFLWVFGNSVNVKMGDVPYFLFYISGGMFAGWVFALFSHAALLGASGAVASVTTAYLVLFPRSRVTVAVFFFIITFVEVPATILIGLKIVLWDNVLAPGIYGAGNVAVTAHLGGYLFGFVAALVMLLIRAVARDHFDMLSLLDRWNRRRGFRSALSTPEARRAYEYGTAARAPQSAEETRAEEQRFDRITDLRTHIAEAVDGNDMAAAARQYQELLTVDSSQCLPQRQQLLLGRQFYSTQRAPQAAVAFERYVSCYGSTPEADEVRLLLGIILARDLEQYGTAEKYLEQSMEAIPNQERRDLCAHWLDVVRRALGKSVADA